jgi:hypothetical protein
MIGPWAAAMRYPRYPWIPQILEPVRQFVQRPVCILVYVSKFQCSSSNGLEMSRYENINLISCRKSFKLANFQFHDSFFSTGYGLETVDLRGCKLANFHCI